MLIECRGCSAMYRVRNINRPAPTKCPRCGGDLSRSVLQQPAPSDPYEVLGLRHGACTVEIDEAFARLAFAYHPLRHPDLAEATAVSTRILEAYESLRKCNAG